MKILLVQLAYLGQVMKYWKVNNDLPLYIIPCNGSNILYSAGRYILLNENLREKVELFLADRSGSSISLPSTVLSLIEHSETSHNQWRMMENGTFAAHCLTVYISYDCKLNCIYCFSRKNDKASIVSIEAVEKAANIVARGCKQDGKPFTFVIHGGGEPTYHWDKFLEVYHVVRQIAESYSLPIVSYISTNGYVDGDKANWLASHIDIISLSFDGPDEIQTVQRANNCDSVFKEIADFVDNVKNAGSNLSIRATITPNTVHRQKEIAEFIVNELKIQNIRFEPVYRFDNGFKTEDAQTFVENFLEAESYCNEYGVELCYSGIRMDEIHRSYCDIYRNTVRLLPEGLITNCFCDNIIDTGYENIISEYKTDDHHIELNYNKISKLRARGGAVTG